MYNNIDGESKVLFYPGCVVIIINVKKKKEKNTKEIREGERC